MNKAHRTIASVGLAMAIAGAVPAAAQTSSESGRVVWTFNPANSINDPRPCYFFVIESSPGAPWSRWFAIVADSASSSTGNFNSILAQRAIDQVNYAFVLNMNNAQPLLNVLFNVGQPIPQCNNALQAYQLQWQATGQ